MAATTAAPSFLATGRGKLTLALLCAVAFDRATTAFKWMRDHYLVLTAVSGFSGMPLTSSRGRRRAVKTSGPSDESLSPIFPQ